MSYLKFYDGAWPFSGALPGVAGVCGYIGGDAANVWSAADWAAQSAYRYRLPIYVRSNPAGFDPLAEAGKCVSALQELAAPKGIAVALDSETSIAPSFVVPFTAAVNAAGYRVIEYGSRDYVLQNDNPDGLYWVAAPGAATALAGFQGTQYYWGNSYDLSYFDATFVYRSMWDTQNPKPKPAPAPLPVNPVRGLQVSAGWAKIRASWDETHYATHYEVTLHSNGIHGHVIDKVLVTGTSHAFTTSFCPRRSLFGVQVRACPSASHPVIAGVNVRTK